MAMNLGSGSGDNDVMVDINTTPLIDVMLVLLIMLIITIPIQLHSVNLNMPQGAPPAQQKDPVVVTIDIDFDGTVLWNGERCRSQKQRKSCLDTAGAIRLERPRSNEGRHSSCSISRRMRQTRMRKLQERRRRVGRLWSHRSRAKSWANTL